MFGFIERWAAEFWSICLESGLWLIAGFLLAGFVHTLIPQAWLARHLSGRGFWPIAKASLLGIPLPLCSCSVIPVAAGLRRSGASRGASAAFTISTPQTGEESIPLTWALFGPVFALIRPVIAVLTAFTAGSLIQFLAPETEPGEPESTEPKPEASCCSSTPAPSKACCHDQPETDACCAPGAGAPDTPSLGARLTEGLRFGFITMPKDLAVWLLIGLALSALIAAAIPEGWIESNIGTGLAPMLLMLVVGLPLYICATSSTPVAFTLVVAGLSPGAALVLLLAGPASNAATMAWVIKDLGGRALAIYLVVIALFAVGSGLLFDTLLARTVTLADHAMAHEHSAVGALQTTGALALLAMLGVALALRFWPSAPGAPDACACSAGCAHQH
ncbi:MAG: SO_0444 family Cu/Zn efflux transporter [Phycisphaerales bacterium JB059]